MEFETVEFDPQKAEQDDWDKFHAFNKIMHDHLRPEDPRIADEISQRNMMIQLKNPEFFFKAFGIFEKGKLDDMIGIQMYGWFKEESQMYEQNQHVAIIDIQLIPSVRGNGIGKKLLKFAYEKVNEKGKKFVMGNTEEEAGRQFGKTIGANEALAMIENRLKYADVDWDLMRQWVKTGEERNPNTKLQFHFEIPEEIIKHYADVYTETLKQVPMGELDFEPIQTPELIRKSEKEMKEQEKLQLTAITVESDDEISGLTELIYNPHLEVRLGQNLTSVREHHRGRGLGKWLKAAALLKAKDDWTKTEYVVTGNATTNAPMLGINDKMGFKLHKQVHSLQVPVETIGNYLKKAEVVQTTQ